MAAIKNIYKTVDTFRFPIWELGVNYPANTVVAVYDSDLGVYEHYVTRRAVDGTRAPNEADSDWASMYFDSDVAMRYVTRVFYDNFEALRAFLQPSVDSDAKVFLDSEFAILARNVDSDMWVIARAYSDYDSDQRVIFDTTLRAYLESRITQIRSDYDSDFAIFENKVSSWDSDHQRYDFRINNFFAEHDSDIFELRSDYNNLAGAVVADQIITNNNTARIANLEGNNATIAGLQTTVNAIPSTYQTLTNATNNYNTLTSNYTTADNAVRAAFVVADNAVRTAFGSADNVVRSEFAAADASIRTDFTAADAKIIADHDSDKAVVTSQLNNVLSQYIAVSNIVSNWSTTPPRDGADSDWVIRQITTGITVSGADSDWVISQLPGAVSAAIQVDSDWVLRQIPTSTSTTQVDSDWVLRQIPASTSSSLDSDFKVTTNNNITTLDNSLNAEVVNRQNADNTLTALINSKPDSDWVIRQTNNVVTGTIFTLQGDIAAGNNGQIVNVYDWGLNGTTFLNGATVVHMNMALIQVGTSNTRFTYDEVIHFAGGTNTGSYFKVGTTTTQGTSPGTVTPVFPVAGTNWFSRVSLSTNSACKWYIWGTKY